MLTTTSSVLFILLISYSLALSPPPATNRSNGFGTWAPTQPNECSTEIHNLFWVRGPDGKVYHTWHPTSYTDAKGKTCYFGHEHGDDPKTSFFRDEAIPFGYVNEVAAAEGVTMRTEDHVGHKIQVQNNIQTHLGNNRNNKVHATCHALVKVHMGVYSNDAFVNNLHEVFVFLKCDDGRHMRLKFLNAFGKAGQFFITDQCPDRLFKPVFPDTKLLPPHPRHPPAVQSDGARKLLDRQCINQYMLKPAGQTTDFDRSNGEHWVIGVARSFFKEGRQMFFFQLNPYLTVRDPIRFFDPQQTKSPLFVSYVADQCFLNSSLKARGPECDRLAGLGLRPPNVWKSVHSPFKGTIRNFSPNRIIILNTSPVKTFYSNALLDANSFSDKPFKNSIKQYVDGNVPNEGNDADIFMDFKNWNAPGVHAPN